MGCVRSPRETLFGVADLTAAVGHMYTVSTCNTLDNETKHQSYILLLFPGLLVTEIMISKDKNTEPKPVVICIPLELWGDGVVSSPYWMLLTSACGYTPP